MKFGRHIDVFAHEANVGTGLFVVPYNDIKASCKTSREDFEQQWRENLDMASIDFHSAISQFWAKIFSKITSADESRGALPGIAINLYRKEAGREAAQELLVRLKQIYEASYHNSEALRKLVKKFDKKNSSAKANPLSPVLLPLVYTANFTLAQLTIEEGIVLLRDMLFNDNDDYVREDGSVNSYDSDRSFHEQTVVDRQAELDWLHRGKWRQIF